MLFFRGYELLQSLRIIKLELNWVNGTAYFNSYNNNSKALNDIFIIVDVNQFRLISTCDIAEEVWDILQVDTKNQQDSKSKRQMLTTQFENLKTGDEENFEIFYAKLCDI